MQYNFTQELSEFFRFVAGVGTAARLFITDLQHDENNMKEFIVYIQRSGGRHKQ